MKKLWRRIAVVCWLAGGFLFLPAVWRDFGPIHPWLRILSLVWFLIPVALVYPYPLKRKALTAQEMASLIERFLENRSLYPQEWNDFVECSQPDKEMDRFRKHCDELDPLVNCPGTPDEDSVLELRAMIRELRN
jgi:hypothetical protein